MGGSTVIIITQDPDVREPNPPGEPGEPTVNVKVSVPVVKPKAVITQTTISFDESATPYDVVEAITKVLQLNEAVKAL